MHRLSDELFWQSAQKNLLASFVRVLTNSQIAELLAGEAVHAKQPLQRALRRASRRAFLWPQEARQLVEQGQSLTALSGVGPYLSKLIGGWLETPPPLEEAPEIRQNFLTLADANCLLADRPGRFRSIQGDLQMHSVWSDGSGSIRNMTEEAVKRGYSYIAITDQPKGLKIAGGIDEAQLAQQAEEINEINDLMRQRPFSTRAPFH